MDNLLPNTVFAPATLPLLDKDQLLDYADRLVSEYVDLGQDIIQLTVLSAKLEVIAQRLKDRSKVACLNEIRNYGKDGLTRFGVLLTVREVGVSYDYSTDLVWQELNQAVVQATALRKAHEEHLRKLPYTGTLTVNESTGEEYRAYPPAKNGSENVTLSIQ